MAIHVKFPNFVNVMSINDLKSYFRQIFMQIISFLTKLFLEKNNHVTKYSLLCGNMRKKSGPFYIEMLVTTIGTEK